MTVSELELRDQMRALKVASDKPAAPDFDDLDMVIGQAHGLAVCLEALAQDFPGLCNPDPMANGINSIIRALKAQIEQVQSVSDEVRRGLK